jgi:integrase
MNLLKRRRKYQFGTLTTEDRKDGKVYVYRYLAVVDGKKTRPKVIVGRTNEMTEEEAYREIEYLRMKANAEHPQASITMRGLIERYRSEILRPCLLPIGGVQSLTARMSHGCVLTYQGYLTKWIQPKWETYEARDFERPEIQAAIESWLASLLKSPSNPRGLAPRTVRGIFNAMRLTFKFGLKWGYLKFNPLSDKRVELPRGSTKREKKAAQLTAAQFFLLLSHLTTLARLAVALLGWLGARVSEVFGLRWQDLDLEQGVVSFRQGWVSGRFTPLKTEASRTSLPIPEDVLKLLLEWRSTTPYDGPEDPVFASEHSGGKRPYWPGAILPHIQSVARKLGLPKVSWHSFRHSVSAWAKKAVTLEEAKQLLRHEKLQTTSEIYGGMDMDEKRAIQRQLIGYIKKTAKAQGWKGQRPPEVPDWNARRVS